jgi:membrane dipeptidase
MNIADLHGDLLCYIQAKKERTPHDRAVRCSLPQLQAGRVKLQVLPVFTHTDALSIKNGWDQIAAYKSLAVHYPKDVLQPSTLSWPPEEESLYFLLAFENASGFCLETEPLQQGIERLHSIIQEVNKLAYISLTWNMENRFGGGALTQIGLKEDGKHLLDFLDQKNIAIDLSHASDRLAYEVIDYIENKGLILPLIASHSNARAIKDVPRNLPDAIAQEIIRREGLIGLNLFLPFIGETEEDLLKHLAYWLDKGGSRSICMGADFFYEKDFTHLAGKAPYLDRFQDASCYPALLNFVQRELKISQALIDQWAYGNVARFLKEQSKF